MLSWLIGGGAGGAGVGSGFFRQAPSAAEVTRTTSARREVRIMTFSRKY
jgi:hypothetical protein